MATELRRDINITPLVDIVLVLLIVFIVLVPVLPRALGAVLPRGDGSGPAAPLVRLTLGADGSIDLDGSPVTLAELPERVRSTAGKVVLRVHPSLPLHRATRVMDALKVARPEAVPALVTLPEGA